MTTKQSDLICAHPDIAMPPAAPAASASAASSNSASPAASPDLDPTYRIIIQLRSELPRVVVTGYKIFCQSKDEAKKCMKVLAKLTAKIKRREEITFHILVEGEPEVRYVFIGIDNLNYDDRIDHKGLMTLLSLNKFEFPLAGGSSLYILIASTNVSRRRDSISVFMHGVRLSLCKGPHYYEITMKGNMDNIELDGEIDSNNVVLIHKSGRTSSDELLSMKIRP